MDTSSYKEIITRRGLKYSYFASPRSESSVTALLLHGFPCTARDWRRQVPVLQQAGHRVLVPDMLGYGGTDKPLKTELYKYSEMCADLIDILDAENVDKAIVIGHDWGCAMASRLANYYPERFLAFAFLAVGYVVPQTSFDYQAIQELTRKTFGYDLFGYWKFFAEEGAHDILRDHWDSYYGLLHPIDPALWKHHLAPLGTLKQWLLEDRQSPLPAYVTQEDKDIAARGLLSGVGFNAPANWYKIVTGNVAWEDNKNVKEENVVIKQPVFFGGAELDCICISATYKARMPAFCPNLTVREYERDHWLIIDRPDELNFTGVDPRPHNTKDVTLAKTRLPCNAAPPHTLLRRAKGKHRTIMPPPSKFRIGITSAGCPASLEVKGMTLTRENIATTGKKIYRSVRGK